MNKKHLQLKQITSDLESENRKQDYKRLSSEIEQMLSSPEIKKFEAFLIESLTFKQRLSEKFSQFTPITLKQTSFQCEDDLRWNRSEGI
ncbi:unnamed protein product [Paramecium octaurelia]|uniref:Uncharacterized protein n=1 Tax=Paramecium octaurelia TaxID=43137 RepID=A0A8S1TAW0_PAROT|nr:unnamed protein product [Paramecium octaurelia]